MEIKKILVVGAGQMGGGIAQVAAASGFEVLLADMDEAHAKAGRDAIAARLTRAIEKGQLDKVQADATLRRIQTIPTLAGGADVDFAVEAATENRELKARLFAEMDRTVRGSAILASNTSSISITALAATTKRPHKVIGMHFMNPVPVMKLVEVIRGLATDDATYAATCAMAQRMGKTTVTSKDAPGFVVNRILMPMINEAFFALHEGLASAEDIDAAMKLGTNQPMGPLALADFVGLDTCLAILQVLHTEIGDPKFRPSPLLRKYVEAGWFGKKAGRGVYSYGG